MTAVERYQRLFIYFKFSWGTYRILRSALFWEIMQCRRVISYRLSVPSFLPKISQNFGTELPLYTA